MTDAHFLRHEPCPRCGSRNNLGVWSDGHKWCFGCHFYIPGTETIHSVKGKIEGGGTGVYPDADIDSSDWAYHLPDVVQRWLDKYGITPGEVVHFGLAWNKKTESLVLPIKRGGQVLLAQERYFGPDPSRPKYITYGQRNKNFLHVQSRVNTDALILTEDYLSAIKVGRFVNAVPVLGSSIPENVVKWAAGRFKRVRVWFDMDKAVESVTEAAKLSQYIWEARSIITELDPKEYTPQEILNTLKSYGIS